VAQEEKSIPQVVSELKELTIAYAKQETVDPLKNLYREVGFGVIGAVLIGAGLLFVSLSALRLLQTQTDDHLTGSLTWVPYVGALAVLVFGIALCGLKIYRKGKRL